MMTVYPGDLRVVRFVNRSEVFVPASEAQIVCFYLALDRDLPRRFPPMIKVLGEAFPQVAVAYRQIGIAEPEARIGADLGEYATKTAVEGQVFTIGDARSDACGMSRSTPLDQRPASSSTRLVLCRRRRI